MMIFNSSFKFGILPVYFWYTPCIPMVYRQYTKFKLLLLLNKNQRLITLFQGNNQGMATLFQGNGREKTKNKTTESSCFVVLFVLKYPVPFFHFIMERERG